MLHPEFPLTLAVKLKRLYIKRCTWYSRDSFSISEFGKYALDNVYPVQECCSLV